jgi:hypothetical protein
MAAELFRLRAGVDFTIVSYYARRRRRRQDLAAGRLDFTIDSPTLLMRWSARASCAPWR